MFQLKTIYKTEIYLFQGTDSKMMILLYLVMLWR